jgi:hypothetical protein
MPGLYASFLSTSTLTASAGQRASVVMMRSASSTMAVATTRSMDRFLDGLPARVEPATHRIGKDPGLARCAAGRTRLEPL